MMMTCKHIRAHFARREKMHKTEDNSIIGSHNWASSQANHYLISKFREAVL